MSVIISNYNEIKPGPGLWKFNNFLISDKNLTEKLKKIIKKLKDLDVKNSFDDQVKWEYLKFEIQKFMKSCSKIHAKNNRKIKNELENKLKDLEKDLNNYYKLQKCNKIKSEPE